MHCVICKQGEMQPGTTTVTLQRGDSIVVFKGVPAQVCPDCGDFLVDEATAEDLLQRAEAAVRAGAEVAVQRFAA